MAGISKQELDAAITSLFDPPTEAPASPHLIAPLSPLRFGPTPEPESSDEETRAFILKNDGFVPKPSKTPRVALRKTPRLKNAPTCVHTFKRGHRKGEVCGALCKIGDELCSRHKTVEKPSASIDYESIAVKQSFKRLKVSKKYKLLKALDGYSVIFECEGRILRVRLPKELLLSIPKTGCNLKFERGTSGSRPKGMWE